MRDVGMAFVQVLHAGTEAQVAEAGKVLAETRRSLYRILADGEPDRGGRLSDPRRPPPPRRHGPTAGGGDGRPPAVIVRGLAKRYDEVEAVAGIDFELRAGETFGSSAPGRPADLAVDPIRRAVFAAPRHQPWPPARRSTRASRGSAGACRRSSRRAWSR